MSTALTEGDRSYLLRETARQVNDVGCSNGGYQGMVESSASPGTSTDLDRRAGIWAAKQLEYGSSGKLKTGERTVRQSCGWPDLELCLTPRFGSVICRWPQRRHHRRPCGVVNLILIHRCSLAPWASSECKCQTVRAARISRPDRQLQGW